MTSVGMGGQLVNKKELMQERFESLLNKLEKKEKSAACTLCLNQRSLFFGLNSLNRF